MISKTNSPISLGVFEWNSHTLREWELLASQVGHRPVTQFRSQNRYLEHVAGRGSLAILADRLNWKFTLTTGPYGELKVQGRNPTFASVSHTSGIAVGVLSQEPIGVDIERVSRKMSDKVIRRICRPEELRELPPIFLWSAKEAVSKAFGLGIKFGLSAFEIVPLDKDSAKVEIHRQYPTAFTLREPQVCFILHKNWVISICSEKNNFSTPIKRIESP